MTKTKTRTVQVVTFGPGYERKLGRKYPLAPMEKIGEGSCPGEAHSNAFIDNCGICAPRWGVVAVYAEQGPDLCDRGFAVPVNRTNEEAMEEAEKRGRVELVHVEERFKGGVSSYYVWVSVDARSERDS